MKRDLLEHGKLLGYHTPLNVATHVDDIRVFSDSNGEIYQFYQQLPKYLPLKDLGDNHDFLGMEVNSSKEGVKLFQKKHTKKVLKRFGKFQACINANKTHGEATTSSPANSDSCDSQFPCQTAIASQLYLAVNTRPDILYAVVHLSQFMPCYNDSRWTAAKHTLRFVKGTISRGLSY